MDFEKEMIDSNVASAAVMRRRREIISGGRQIIYYAFDNMLNEKLETVADAEQTVDADLVTLEAHKEQQRDVRT